MLLLHRTAVFLKIEANGESQNHDLFPSIFAAPAACLANTHVL